MKDGLREFVFVAPPLRRCEWCFQAAVRGQDLCADCQEDFAHDVRHGLELTKSDFDVEAFLKKARGGG